MGSTAQTPRVGSLLAAAVVATGLGVALLAGGGGTLATWYDEVTTEGATITSGDLGLTAGEGVWFNADGEVVDVADYLIVPGETLTFTQDVTIDATGDQLEAVLRPSVPEPVDGGNDLSQQLRANAVFVLDGTNVDPAEGRRITAEDDGEILEVMLSVTFPDAGPRLNGTLAQDQTATLQGITIELEQTAVTSSESTPTASEA